MRAAAFTIIAVVGLAAHPVRGQPGAAETAFWKSVQKTCNAAAAKPPNELGQRIAQTAIDEFSRFGGHQIDSDGRLFHFGLTEAEHEEDDGGNPHAPLGHLGWWQVMKYWRVLFGDDPTTKLEVRGYRDASTSTQDAQVAPQVDTSAAELLRLADKVSDPDLREILRETAMRAAIVDTSWSAAFISYVVREAGVGADAFQFSNAHRAYIYDAFAVSSAEQQSAARTGIYRACPLTTTRARPGDLICQQRESLLADATAEAVRERIRGELDGSPDARTVRRTHCEVVAHVDRTAEKVYTIGGNVNQAVTARKMNLRGNLTFSPSQKGSCGGQGHWTLPPATAAAATAAGHARKCSLNDRKWFVLLQLR